jgi:hypothetical protein
LRRGTCHAAARLLFFRLLRLQLLRLLLALWWLLLLLRLQPQAVLVQLNCQVSYC